MLLIQDQICVLWHLNKSSFFQVVRQTLQHWAYILTEKDFDDRVEEMKKKKK